MPARIVLPLLLTVMTVAIRPPLSAQPAQGAGRLVDRGVQAYLEGDYEKARTLLEQALSAPLEMSRLMGAMQYLGFSLVALGEEEQAGLVFSRLLDLSPRLNLPAATPPKIVRVFEEAARRWRAQHPPPRIVHQPPAKAEAEVSLVLTARVENLRESEKVVVAYQDGADGPLNQQHMKPKPDGSLEAVLPAPLVAADVERLYRIEVLAADGTVMAREPGEGMLRIAFHLSSEATKTETKKPQRTTWWIWALAGAVVAGAAAGLAVGLAGQETNTGRAIVNIVVR